MLTNEKLLQLARLAVPHIETMRERGSDSLDFHETFVASLANAIRAAYELGWQEAMDHRGE